MNKQEILDYLKKNLLAFLDELIIQFPKEGDLILFRIFLKHQISISRVMDYFIEKLLPYKSFILEKNEDFFLKLCPTDEKDNVDKIDKFKTIWKQLDTENKQIMWSWFNNFLYIVEKYDQYPTK